MSIDAYELGQYKQIFDRLQYGKVANITDVEYYGSFSRSIDDVDMASDKEIKAVDEVSEMFVETINNPDVPQGYKDAAESSLKQLADKGFVSAQEQYIELLHERGDYKQAYTYADNIANSDMIHPAFDSYTDEGWKKDEALRNRMSEYAQEALTGWSENVSDGIDVGLADATIGDETRLKRALTNGQILVDKIPDSDKKHSLKDVESYSLAEKFYEVAKNEESEISPELRESAQASLKQLADKGYFHAQKQYAHLMERHGNYDEAFTYMDKAANNTQADKNQQEMAAADAQDYLYDGKYKDSFERLGTVGRTAEDVRMCKEFCEKAKPGLIGTEGTNKAIEKISDALDWSISSKKKQELTESLKGLADKGYLSAQVEMAYKGSSSYEQVYTYADKAAKYMQEDDYFKGEKSDQALKVSCALVNTANNAKNPELRAKAEASLKQMADKGCFAAQETYANLMEERGDYGKASLYARKASDNEHASEAAQDRLSKYSHNMYQKHQKNREAPKKESPQVLPPKRDNEKPRPSLKERLVDAGSKSAIGIIKASRAFAQSGLQLADTVLDSGVKMVGAFIDVPDLGIGRGLQGYLSQGINKAADVGISMIEAARKKTVGR